MNYKGDIKLFKLQKCPELDKPLPKENANSIVNEFFNQMKFN